MAKMLYILVEVQHNARCKMFCFILEVVLAATLVHHAAADRDTLPKPISRELSSPFVDQRPEAISLSNKVAGDQSLVSEQSYPQHRRDARDVVEEERASLTSSDRLLRINDVQNGLANFLLDAFKTNVQVLADKEKVLAEYVECACSDHGKCRRLSKYEEKDLKIFPWLFSQSNNFQSKINTLKSAVQKLKLRQNALYEYVNCACTNTTACAKDIKPFLSALFNNDDAKVSEEVLRRLVNPKSDSSNAKIFSYIINVIKNKPSLSEFIAHPIDSFLVWLQQIAPAFVVSLLSSDNSSFSIDKPSHESGSGASVSVTLGHKDEKDVGVKPSSSRTFPPFSIYRSPVGEELVDQPSVETV